MDDIFVPFVANAAEKIFFLFSPLREYTQNANSKVVEGAGNVDGKWTGNDGTSQLQLYRVIPKKNSSQPKRGRDDLYHDTTGAIEPN